MKTFDIGLYTFKRQVMGVICPDDDQAMKDGQLVAVLHPFQTVDPGNLYCFGIDKETGDTKTLVRRNLRFRRIVTLELDAQYMTAVQETHAKLNAALDYLKTKCEQLTI